MAGQQSITNHRTVQCQICKKPKRLSAVVPAKLVHLTIVEVILKEYSNWAQDGFICLPNLCLTARLAVPKTPATKRPKSSVTPHTNTAIEPISVHNSGITSRAIGTCGSAHKSNPRVKMVVGHGATPNIGAWG